MTPDDILDQPLGFTTYTLRWLVGRLILGDWIDDVYPDINVVWVRQQFEALDGVLLGWTDSRLFVYDH